MSFLFGGRPQLSSAEKIAAAETEVEMVSDMFSRYDGPNPSLQVISKLNSGIQSHPVLHEEVYTLRLP